VGLDEHKIALPASLTQYRTSREWIQIVVSLEILEMQLFLPHCAFMGDKDLCIAPCPVFTKKKALAEAPQACLGFRTSKPRLESGIFKISNASPG
jgi:hypothetical protein